MVSYDITWGSKVKINGKQQQGHCLYYSILTFKIAAGATNSQQILFKEHFVSKLFCYWKHQFHCRPPPL